MPRRSVGGYLSLGAIVALIALLSKRQGAPPRPISTQDTEANNAQQKPQTTQPKWASPQTNNKGWHSEESRHHRWERWYWGITASLTLIAAVGAIWTVVLSQGTLVETRKAVSEYRNQTRIAQNALTASNRPWIWLKTDPILRGLSIVSNEWAIAQVDIQLTNFGKSPARYVFLATKLVPRANETKAADIQDFLCRSINLAEKLPTGSRRLERTIFSDQPITFFNEFITTDTSEKIPTLKNGTVDGDFIAVGCIQYAIPDDELTHHSGFMLDIGRADNKVLEMQIGSQADVSTLRLSMDYFGGSPAD